MTQLEKWFRGWHVVTTKDIFVGQGISYNEGDSWGSFFTIEEANATASRLNDDDWNPGVWTVEFRKMDPL